MGYKPDHLSRTTEQRFFEKVDKAGPKILPTQCWQWVGSSGDRRYGQFWYRKKITKAHRASYLMHVGPIRGERLVLHRCDNTRCVRPEHLFLGTPQDNTDDCRAKGRVPMGNRRKLSAKEASQIRKLCGDGVKMHYIAAAFGVGIRTVQKIKRGEYWKTET